MGKDGNVGWVRVRGSHLHCMFFVFCFFFSVSCIAFCIHLPSLKGYWVCVFDSITSPFLLIYILHRSMGGVCGNMFRDVGNHQLNRRARIRVLYLFCNSEEEMNITYQNSKMFREVYSHRSLWNTDILTKPIYLRTAQLGAKNIFFIAFRWRRIFLLWERLTTSLEKAVQL